MCDGGICLGMEHIHFLNRRISIYEVVEQVRMYLFDIDIFFHYVGGFGSEVAVLRAILSRNKYWTLKISLTNLYRILIW